jgi:hypothetical protein
MFAPFSTGQASLLGSLWWLTGVTLRGMAGRVRVRKISDDEGNRKKRIVRRGSGSVVTWRRAQMVLWSAQGMSVAQIAGLAFSSEDRVRDVLHNFNADGFESLYPRYAGGLGGIAVRPRDCRAAATFGWSLRGARSVVSRSGPAASDCEPLAGEGLRPASTLMLICFYAHHH